MEDAPQGRAKSSALHPVLSPEQRRRLLAEGIEHFNAGRYYEAHEAWEEIWRSTDPEPKDLFRGLIQIAVGLHHFWSRGNPGPAQRVLARGLRRVQAFEQGSLGLDLVSLLEEAGDWVSWLEQAEGEPPRRPVLRGVGEVVAPSPLERGKGSGRP